MSNLQKISYDKNREEILKLIKYSKFNKSKSTQKTHFYSLWDFTKFLAEKKNHILSENKSDEIAKAMTEFTNEEALDAKLLVGEYLAYLEDKNQSTSTIATKLSAIKDHITFQKGYTNFPTWDLDIFQAPKVENKKVEGLTEDEYKNLLNYISKLEISESYIDKRNALICYVLSLTALRVSELLSINIEEINIYASKILVNRKNKKEKQEFYLGKLLLNKIQSFLKDDGRSSGPLFINKDKIKRSGERLTRQSVYRIVKNLGELVEIKNLHPHRFRHFAATEARILTGDNDLAMKFTSHLSDKIFRRYVDERENKQLKVSEMLEEKWLKN